jgi:hypothetical protein
VSFKRVSPGYLGDPYGYPRQIVKMFSLPQAEEVNQCPIYNKSIVPFSTFTVNSPLLRHPKQPSLLLC